MRAQVYGLDGEPLGWTDLPPVFETPLNRRLINRAFWIQFTHMLQRKGRDPEAGERTSAISWNTGHGVARMARVKGERNPRAGQAAGVAGVVKGRLPHPPKVEKVIYKRMNRKERILALMSAISATTSKETVASRGHRISKVPDFPLVVDDKLQQLSKASELRAFLEKMGLNEDIERTTNRKRRAGKSSWRGRGRRNGKGPLIVVAADQGVGRAAGSFPGVDVLEVDDLNVLELAPGGNPGRLTVWTRSSLDALSTKFAGVLVNAA
jgi:large subunit ribosomal protein L4e